MKNTNNNPIPFEQKRQGKYTENNTEPIKLNPPFDNLGKSETILNHFDKLKKDRAVAGENKGIFKVKTANQWMELAKESPIPQMLFGEFWFEDELCILFADTNQGKSILAVQIADSISKGERIRGFKLEAQKQPVLYFDFELSKKQFEGRYSVRNEAEKVYEQHYSFDDNFIRIEINPDAESPDKESFEDSLNKSLEQSVIETSAKILIIDNITYLKNETENSKNAAPLMKHLKALKNKYGLSILAIAHTPKRDLSKPISRNDLAGSKMLMNFLDSCFAIGESHRDPKIKYFKQIKVRATEFIYTGDNVVVCQLKKPHNFLEFEFMGFGTEQEHLKQYSDTDRETRISEALELKKQGVSNVQIAKQVGVSEGAVRKWIKKNNENE